MTPADEPPSNPYDPNWPKPEHPYGQAPGQPPADQPPAEQGPYGQPPAAGQPPYAPYGQEQPYGQAPYGQQQPYGQVPYGAPTYGGPMLPKHPSATTTELLALARAVRDGVEQAFGVRLVNEPVLVGCRL